MTLYQYNLLSTKEKAELLWEHGVMVADRSEGKYRLALYQIEAFYVEVYYNVQRNNIEKLRSFSSTNALQPYLKTIELPDLL